MVQITHRVDKKLTIFTVYDDIERCSTYSNVQIQKQSPYFTEITVYIKIKYITRLLQRNFTWDLAQFKELRTESHNQCWLRWSKK